MAFLPQEILLKAGALQNAIFSNANFSSIAKDANGVIQIFNVGAERMLGSSRMIGAIELAEVCESMERAARQGSCAEVMMADVAMGGALVRLDAHLAEAKRIIAE